MVLRRLRAARTQHHRQSIYVNMFVNMCIFMYISISMSTFIEILIAYELIQCIPIKHSTTPSGGTNEKLEGLHPPLGQCHCEPQGCEMQQQWQSELPSITKRSISCHFSVPIRTFVGLVFVDFVLNVE